MGDDMLGTYPKISPDGEWILSSILQSGLNRDLVAYNINEQNSVVIANTVENEIEGSFSIDGKYVAFRTGSTSLASRLFVKDFFGDTSYEISEETGLYRLPKWSVDGQYLYYATRNELFRVRIETKPEFRQLERPRAVASFNRDFVFALHPDGERILTFNRPLGQAEEGQINLTQNWFHELNQIAPPSN